MGNKTPYDFTKLPQKWEGGVCEHNGYMTSLNTVMRRDERVKQKSRAVGCRLGNWAGRTGTRLQKHPSVTRNIALAAVTGLVVLGALVQAVCEVTEQSRSPQGGDCPNLETLAEALEKTHPYQGVV